MRLTLLMWVLSAATAGADAAVEKYTLDPGHTYPSFEIDHIGFSNQKGWFEKAAGGLTWDRAAGQGELNVEIDAASVYSGHPVRDNVLKGEQFFDVNKHPRITYRSRQLVFTPAGTLQAVEGDLTMRGVTKPVRLEVTAFRCGDHPVTKKPMCGGHAAAQINKADFGTFGGALLGQTVRLSIQFEGYREP